MEIQWVGEGLEKGFWFDEKLKKEEKLYMIKILGPPKLII